MEMKTAVKAAEMVAWTILAPIGVIWGWEDDPEKKLDGDVFTAPPGHFEDHLRGYMLLKVRVTSVVVCALTVGTAKIMAKLV